MRFRQLTVLLGPVAIRDLLVGSGGVTVGGFAFIAGCAYAGLPTLVWFTLLSIVGAVSLGMALPVLRLVLSLPPMTEKPEATVASFRVAA